MALRLVLVGVVASLGLSLPSGETLEAWTRSSQAWINARLAEWESRRTVDEGAFVFVAKGDDPAPRTCPVADLAAEDHSANALMEEWISTALKAPTLTSTTTPTPVAETSKGMEIVNEPGECEGSRPPAPLSTSKLAETTPPQHPTWLEIDFQLWMESLELEESRVSEPAEPRPATVALADAKQLDQAFNTAVDEMIASFRQDIETASKAAAQARAEELDKTFNAAVDEMIASFHQNQDQDRAPATVQAAEPRMAHAASPAFEPMDVDDNYYRGVAYELNRASEGIVRPAPAPAPVVKTEAQSTTAGASPRDSRLATAVRLTREAVNAWASLLHGPAVVTITR
jgi:hypothetical protein